MCSSILTDNQASGLVFGIPLSKCISNDKEQRKRSSGPLRERKDSDVIIHRQGPPRKSSSSSQGSIDNYTQNGTSFSDSQKVGSVKLCLSYLNLLHSTNMYLVCLFNATCTPLIALKGGQSSFSN